MLKSFFIKVHSLLFKNIKYCVLKYTINEITYSPIRQPKSLLNQLQQIKHW